MDSQQEKRNKKKRRLLITIIVFFIVLITAIAITVVLKVRSVKNEIEKEIIESGDFDRNGYHDGDEEALQALIDRQRELGASVQSIYDEEQYRWEDGRLVEIHWSSVRLKGDISFAGLDELEYIFCDDNKLTSIDTDQNPKLRGLVCGGGNINSLDVSQNTELEFLYCSENNLS